MVNARVELTELERAAKNLKFELLRNAFYHGDELKFFLALERWTKLISAMLGIAVAGYGIAKNSFWGIFFGLGITFMQIGGLVFGWSGRTVLHEGKRQKYFYLLSELERQPPTEELILHIQGEMTKIWAEEPAQKWGVEVMARNSAMMAMKSSSELKPGDIIPIYPWEKRVRNIFSFSPEYFRKRHRAA